MRMGRNWVGIQNFKPCSYTNTRHWYYTGICCLISIVLDSVSMTEEVLLTELLFVFLHQTLSVISTKLSFCYHGYRQTQWADQGSLKAHNASLLLHGMKFLQLHNLTHHCFFLLTQNCYKISLFKHWYRISMAWITKLRYVSYAHAGSHYISWKLYNIMHIHRRSQLYPGMRK